MALDIIGLTLVIIFFIRGYMKGIIVAAFSLLAITLGIVCSLKLSKELAEWLADKHIVSSAWAQVVSFIILFLVVLFLVRLVAKALETSAKALMLGWVNGGIGGLLYAFLAAVLWSAALWMLVQLNTLEPETIAASKTYKYFAPVAPWTFEKIGSVWPMVKSLLGDVQHFLSSVNKPHDVGTAR